MSEQSKQVMVSNDKPFEKFNSINVQIMNAETGEGGISFLRELDELPDQVLAEVAANIFLGDWGQLRTLRDSINDVLARHEQN